MGKIMKAFLVTIAVLLALGCKSKYEEKLRACYGDPEFVLTMTCDELKEELAARGNKGKKPMTESQKAEQAKVDSTKIWMANVVQALDAYKIQFGNYPTTGQGLQELVAKGVLRGLPMDKWGRELEYIRNSLMSYSLKSYGADGVAGGLGFDEDIVTEQ